MTTTRALRDDITNALDFLFQSGLAIYTTRVAMRSTRVTWYAPSQATFLIGDSHATADHYLDWVSAGHYSAALPDRGLLQITYDVEGGEVTGHRLAYITCPAIIDLQMLRDGEPIADVVEIFLHEQSRAVMPLRSPVRFDFGPGSASEGHPAAHLTFNNSNCRIACVAPMHPYRFIDFVYRHFYPELRAAQEDWFREAARRLLGQRVLTEDDGADLHLTWPLHRQSS